MLSVIEREAEIEESLKLLDVIDLTTIFRKGYELYGYSEKGMTYEEYVARCLMHFPNRILYRLGEVMLTDIKKEDVENVCAS